MLRQEQKDYLLSRIRDVPDFPTEGVMYKDITPLLSDYKAFHLLNRHLAEHYAASQIDYIIGIESRGFIFGAVLAELLGIGFVPIRKKNKLPPKVIRQEYQLEYGTEVIEIHENAFSEIKNPNVLLIDDVLATGGTALAAIELIQMAGATCKEACFILDLPFLRGGEKIKTMTNVYFVLTVGE